MANLRLSEYNSNLLKNCRARADYLNLRVSERNLNLLKNCRARADYLNLRVIERRLFKSRNGGTACRYATISTKAPSSSSCSTPGKFARHEFAAFSLSIILRCFIEKNVVPLQYEKTINHIVIRLLRCVRA